MECALPVTDADVAPLFHRWWKQRSERSRGTSNSVNHVAESRMYHATFAAGVRSGPRPSFSTLLLFRRMLALMGVRRTPVRPFLASSKACLGHWGVTGSIVGNASMEMEQKRVKER